MKSLLLYPDRDFNLDQGRPALAQELVQDLELETLFRSMSGDSQLIRQTVEKVLLAGLTEPNEVLHRQAILRDCLNNRSMIRELYQTVCDTIEEERNTHHFIFRDDPKYVLSGSIQAVQLFVKVMGRIRDQLHAERSAFQSTGFQNLIDLMVRELSDDYFKEIEQHLGDLKFNNGIQFSARLGQDLKGADFVLRKSNRENEPWFKRALAQKVRGYSFMISDRDERGAKAFAELISQGVILAAEALGQSSTHILSFFKMLQVELAFYVGCLNLAECIEEKGEAFCFPFPQPASERSQAFVDLKDACLALTNDEPVIGNDLKQDSLDLAVITGANQGGKTIFLRSLGLAQVMMQGGLFVVAKSFTAPVCSKILSHFKREEDKTLRSGKLDEELLRMRQIVDQLTANSMLLLNESFAATNEKEGSEIAGQIVKALLEKRVKIVYVTHLNEFARQTYASRTAHMLFLVAERTAEGQRTFRIIPGEPACSSFGEDIYNEVFGDPLATDR
jgi:DNA mismatch repair ATPase MutS